MISLSLVEIIRKILKISETKQLNLAFMGGIACSTRGNPRATYDIDILLGIETRDVNQFLKKVAGENFKYDKRKPVRSLK